MISMLANPVPIYDESRMTMTFIFSPKFHLVIHLHQGGRQSGKQEKNRGF